MAGGKGLRMRSEKQGETESKTPRVTVEVTEVRNKKRDLTVIPKQ